MKKSFVVAALFTFSAPAFCADTGIYSGTTLGHSSVDNPTTSALTKSSDNVFGGFLGYRFNDHFGLEGSYTGLGSYSNTTQSGKADALGLAAVGFAPLGEHFELLGKIGVADAIGKSAKGGLVNTNRIAPMYGIGLQYNVNDSIGLRLGVDRYEAAVKEGSVKRNYNSNVVGFTFIYRY
jgi:OOP family OmpA-OmpF porin